MDSKEKEIHSNLAYMHKEGHAVDLIADLVTMEKEAVVAVAPLQPQPLILTPYENLLSLKALELQRTQLLNTVFEYAVTLKTGKKLEVLRLGDPRRKEVDPNLLDNEFILNKFWQHQFLYNGEFFENEEGEDIEMRSTLVFYLGVKVSQIGSMSLDLEKLELFIKLYNYIVELGLLDFGALLPISRFDLAPYHKDTKRVLQPMSDGTFKNTIFNVTTEMGYGDPNKDIGQQRTEYDAVKDELVQIEDITFQEILLTFVALSEKANNLIKSFPSVPGGRNPNTILNQYVGVDIFFNEGEVSQEPNWGLIKKLVNQKH